MSFTVTTKLPQYAGETGITILITAEGSGDRANGDADDTMVDTDGNFQFVGTVEEDLVGEFEYVIYASGTVIDSGGFYRAEGQEEVILNTYQPLLTQEQAAAYQDALLAAITASQTTLLAEIEEILSAFPITDDILGLIGSAIQDNMSRIVVNVEPSRTVFGSCATQVHPASRVR